ncbi:MAG TPA: hypothetical protein VN618_00830 [Solirubrobacteraceae bacterium]|nr:hypothetical protein [Solirubrobacteraceae bacterium]
MSVLTSTSAIWTLALVGLYLVGVVRHIGELRAAHLPINAAFETVPLQEHLIAGIATTVSPYTLIVVFIAGLSYYQGREIDRRYREGAAPKSQVTKRALVLPSLPAVVTLLVLPWDTAVIVAAGGLFMLGSALLMRHSVVKVAHALALTSLIGLFVIVGADAYFVGHLPDTADARLRSGQILHGSYLGTTGGYVYVGQDRSLVAIPTEEVRSKTVHKGPERVAAESLFQIVTGVRLRPKVHR